MKITKLKHPEYSFWSKIYGLYIELKLCLLCPSTSQKILMNESDPSGLSSVVIPKKQNWHY